MVIGHAIKLLQQFSLPLIELDRRFNNDSAIQITETTPSYLSHVDAFTSEPEHLACLCLPRDFQINPPVQRRHLQFPTQGCIGKTDRYFAIQMLSFSRKDRVLPHLDLHVEIASGTTIDSGLTLTTQSNLIPVIHTGWNFDRQGLGIANTALTATRVTGIRDHLAGAPTPWTGLLKRKETLPTAYLTGTAALNAVGT